MRMRTDWVVAEWPAPEGIVAGTTLRGSDTHSLPVEGDPCWLTQVHGNRVVRAARSAEQPEADASVRGEDGMICVVRTADCLPVLFCSLDGSRYGAAHAGWRGLAAGVLENTVAALDVPGPDLIAWLGPAISQSAFEVGDEVRAEFVAADPRAASCFEANARGRWQADLYALARRRLDAVGVTDVYGGGLCTWHDEARFYSYRRAKDSGRMVSFITAASP